MEIKMVPLSAITPYENNPRRNADAVKYVRKSIEQFGFKVPMVLDAQNVIVCGHTRYLAAQEIGMEEVPCVYADDLSEEQIKAFRLADNKTAEFAEWDTELLSLELGDITDIDMSEFGFDLDYDGYEEPAEIVEDEAPEEVETRCKIGDIWQLGEHRLICGDSTDPAVIDRLMGGVKADMVFTDPPYGMKKESEGVLNDNLNYDDLLDFNRQWIPLTFGALKDNGSWYCWGIDEPLMDIYSNILKPMQKENKITFRNLITWDKGNGQGQLSSGFMMYPIADEKCLFVVCGIQCLTLNADQYWDGYESIRSYMEGEAKKVGLNN
ncbi:MAG: ParB N-terminal domain-containing protein, partial [Lachnospiraceae bacterium]|nr:ParB N-terminal domain-containing protein [Lachnospiraceae bacterium]